MTPTPFTRLMLATERTEFDAGAENVALDMAGHCGLPLAVVLPLVSNAEFEVVAPERAARAEAAALDKLNALQRRAEAAGIRLELQVRRGEEPWQEIVGAARDGRVELLVTRRRGKRGFLAELLVGDMVSKVAAHAPCHVLMAGRGAGMWSRGIVAALDESAAAAGVAGLAIAVAAQCRLPLEFVRVAEAAQREAAGAALQQALAQAAAAGVEAGATLLEGRIHEAVLAALQRLGADLLVIGLRGEHAVERAALGSNARKLIGVAETPVLIVKS